MHDDDLPVGRVLNRREVVRLLALSGAAVLVGCERAAQGAGATASAAGEVAAAGGSASATLPACVVKPELTLGPYFVDKQLERSDIRTEPSSGAATAGVPLVLTFAVSQVANGTCTPLPWAQVDLWQCDAKGVYSGVTDRTVGFDTTGQKFLRGWQTTDANGVARFTTIYPGWYQGRTVHVHFKVRVPAAAGRPEVYDFTSQLFFDEAVSDRVHATPAYAGKGRRDTTNARDGIYRSAGETLLVALAPEGEGYAGRFEIALDLSDAEVGRADVMRRPGRRPRG